MSTLNFTDVIKSKYYSISLLGGKGYNLVKLTEGGFNVPQGFLVTTEAFQKFIKFDLKNGQTLEEFINKQLNTLRNKDGTWMTDMDSVTKVSKSIQEAVVNSSVPEDLEKEILQNSSKNGLYAVRSSGTAEDTVEFSFAGQYETFLNIKTEELLKHIKLCWASLFTVRGIVYRSSNGFMEDSNFNTEICVIVQEMIHSEKSGVMFTANPVNGNRNIISIDACYGLGEALVSGKTNADSYLISKKKFKITNKKLGDKKVSIIHLENGGTEEIEIKEELQKEYALTDKEIEELAKVGNDIEKMYGSVQDIEWGFFKGKFYILQSRSVTSLYPMISKPISGLKESIQSPTPEPYVDNYYRIYYSFNHAQMFQDPFRPLGMSIFSNLIGVTAHLFGGASKTQYRVTHAGGRLYFDITDIISIPNMEKKLEMKSDAEAAKAIKVVKTKDEFKHHGTPLEMGTILSLSQNIFKYGAPALWTYLWTDSSDLQKNITTLFEEKLGEQISELDTVKDDDVFTAIENSAKGYFKTFLDSIGFLLPGFVSATQISKDSQMTFLSGVKNLTTKMGLATGDLTDIAREYKSVETRLDEIVKNNITSTQKVLDLFDENDEGEAKFKSKFREFIKENGHRCQGEIDITNERWSENSIFILTTIFNGIHNGSIGEHQKRFQQSVDKGNADIEEIIKKTEEAAKHSLWNSLTFGNYSKDQVESMKKKIKMAQESMEIREHPKFYIIKLFEKERKMILQLAEKMVKNSLLKEVEDIYYLYVPEIEDLRKNPKDFKFEDVQSLIKKRKSDYQKFLKMNPPALMTSEGEEIQAVPNVDLTKNQLQGLGVSKGKIEGYAKVIFDPLKESIKKGEIMVTSHTDPGWTPLFMTAAGLVTEVGGILTHGSVVAREMGIPAVVGVRNATKKIKTGDYLKIDGTSGLIEICEIK